MLATGLGWLLAGIALKPFPNPLLAFAWQAVSPLSAFVSGVVSGMMVGVFQWWVLRRYVPDWLWILTTTAGYGLGMTTLSGWQQSAGRALHAVPPVSSPAIAAGLGAFSVIWVGLLQWLVLRHYARFSEVWVVVPSLAVLLTTAVLMGTQRLSGHSLPLLHPGLLAAGMSGLVAAIALCTLPRPQTASFPPSQLQTAPQQSRQQTRRFARRLFAILNRTWRGEELCDRPVRYRVGVSETGAIVAYEPDDAIAEEYAHQTPLPELLNPASTKREQPLAHLLVTFLPSGDLLVRPWQGISLLRLSLLMAALLLVFSAIAAALRIPLQPG